LLVAGISAARLRSHERHVNTLLDSVPAVATLAWVMLAASADGVGPLLWGTLVGYAIQTVWLAWLAARADGGFWGSPRLTLRSPHWPELMSAAGVMLIGQVAMSFVGPLDQYAAANLGANANATLGYASRLLSLFYFGVLILVQLLASQNRYRIMSAIAVGNFALKAGLNMVLAPRMGAAGIMLATSLMYLLSYACYLVVALRRVEPQEAD
uniref:hypothetical protein n=1 Tax=Streptomyces virginiae TaxID=1961 RepID=UPI0035DE5359